MAKHNKHYQNINIDVVMAKTCILWWSLYNSMFRRDTHDRRQRIKTPFGYDHYCIKSKNGCNQEYVVYEWSIFCSCLIEIDLSSVCLKTLLEWNCSELHDLLSYFFKLDSLKSPCFICVQVILLCVMSSCSRNQKDSKAPGIYTSFL